MYRVDLLLGDLVSGEVGGQFMLVAGRSVGLVRAGPVKTDCPRASRWHLGQLGQSHQVVAGDGHFHPIMDRSARTRSCFESRLGSPSG